MCVKHNGTTLEIRYRVGITALGSTTSAIQVEIYQRGGRVECHPPRIEIPATKEGLQPIKEALEERLGESDAQVLLNKLIATLVELDTEVLTVKPNIFLQQSGVEWANSA